MKPSRRADVRRARSAQLNSVTMNVDTADLDELLDQLGDDVEEAVRPAAQAGAQVLYDQVQRNVSRIGQVSGNLASAIYQVFSKDNSAAGKATYHISWNARIAPHGHLIEFGHLQTHKAYIGSDGNWYTNLRAPLATPEQIAARPFIRPALLAKGAAALDAARDELLSRLPGFAK